VAPRELLHLRGADERRGLRAFREDLGGFAFGWLMVLLLVGATAIFFAMRLASTERLFTGPWFLDCRRARRAPRS
jgi:hypothetical protein